MGKNDLAVFDLGLMTLFCSNPACLGNLQQDGFTRHLQGGCLEYYRDEGKKLFQWDGDLGAKLLCNKLSLRRAHLRHFVKEAGNYEENLAQTLKIVCVRCKIRGPLLTVNEHKMFVSHSPGGMQWVCSKCQKGDERHEDMVLNGTRKGTWDTRRV